jgi:hypothetical protein
MLGMEPTKRVGPFVFFDEAKAGAIAREELAKIGIEVNHLDQKVGTMSGGALNAGQTPQQSANENQNEARRALGRGLEYYDKCAVDKILAALEQNDYRITTLIVETVNSDPFQMRTATGEKP